MAKLTVGLRASPAISPDGLIEQLEADDRIGRVLGFDLREPDSAPSKLVFDQSRHPQRVVVASRLRGVDVVVHLAFVMDPIKDESTCGKSTSAGVRTFSSAQPKPASRRSSTPRLRPSTARTPTTISL